MMRYMYHRQKTYQAVRALAGAEDIKQRLEWAYHRLGLLDIPAEREHLPEHLLEEFDELMSEFKTIWNRRNKTKSKLARRVVEFAFAIYDLSKDGEEAVVR